MFECKIVCSFTTMITNSELVQKLANGYRVREIAKEIDINTRTLEKRILVLKKQYLCKTVSHLVANYLRRKIIE